MLTREQIANINNRMINQGAPVEINNVGYNKLHFDFMYKMSCVDPEHLTDNQIYAMLNTLKSYVNTQLVDYKDEILESLKAVSSKLRELKVIDFDDNSVKLFWSRDAKVSAFIRNMDKSLFKWIKEGENWYFRIRWDGVQDLMSTMSEQGFDTSEVLRLLKTVDLCNLKPLTSNIVTNINPKELTGNYTVNIERPNNSVDTLTLNVEYNRNIVEAIKTVNSAKYRKHSKSWEFDIDDSSAMYTALSQLNGNIDLKSLEPWKKLVDSWDTFNFTPQNFPNVKFKPYDFQLEDVATMLSKKRVLNANDMGCGKTHEAVRAGESIPMKKLVICPASLRLNWEQEIRFVNPKANVTILYNDSEFTTSDWTIIGYPSVSKHLEALEKENFQVLIVDEAHYCQAISNSGRPDSQRAFAVLRLAATAGYVFPLTGTPKTNRNKNVFNTLRMIKHPLTKGNWAFHNFGIEYCDGEQTPWGWDFEGNSNDEELHDELSPYMIRHLKKEVLPNLKKQRISIPVKVDLTEYNYEIQEYLRTRKKDGAEALARLMRARKILATQKVGETIDFAKTIINEGNKVVIVTCFTDVVKTIEKAFKGNVVKLVGGMTDDAKNNAITEFQTGNPQVMVMNIIAGGVGVTLTKSHNMIINDVDFVPGNVMQAEDRICRSGQVEEYSIIHYMTALGADVEETFIDMLTYKSDTINQAIDGGEGDAIDFRSLVDKSNGITSDKTIRRMVKVEEKEETKSNSELKPSNSSETDWKQYSTEELEDIAKKNGISYKVYSDPRIHRMRLVMSLKKSI